MTVPKTRALAVLVALAAASCFTREIGDAGSDSAPPPGSDSAATDSGADAARSDAGDASSESGPGPLLDVGQGDSMFVPAREGADVDVHQGPQGGFHIFASMRISGLAPGDPNRPIGDPVQPVTEVIVTSRDGTLLSSVTLPLGYAPAAGLNGTYELIGLPVVLGICACATLAGETITISTTVTDSAGLVATDLRHWIGVESIECAPPVPPCGS